FSWVGTRATSVTLRSTAVAVPRRYPLESVAPSRGTYIDAGQSGPTVRRDARRSTRVVARRPGARDRGVRAHAPSAAVGAAFARVGRQQGPHGRARRTDGTPVRRLPRDADPPGRAGHAHGR